MVKREIHFGIIDYVTTYQVKRQFDEMGAFLGKESMTVRPAVYSERFLKTMRKIFQ